MPRRFEHGAELGAVAPRASGGLVLGAGRALVATDLDGGGAETLVAVEPDRPHNRFNDCRVDPAGRFFCGTKTNGDSGGSGGALHRIDADLRATVAIADTGLANGIGWSPDGTTLYFIDSPLQRLDAYEFDPATGEVGGRRTVAEIDPDDGLPDGLAVDAEGGIWVALVKGGDGAPLRARRPHRRRRCASRSPTRPAPASAARTSTPSTSPAPTSAPTPATPTPTPSPAPSSPST